MADSDFKAAMAEAKEFLQLWKDTSGGDVDVDVDAFTSFAAFAAAVAAAKSQCKNVNQNGVGNNSNV